MRTGLLHVVAVLWLRLSLWWLAGAAAVLCRRMCACVCVCVCVHVYVQVLIQRWHLTVFYVNRYTINDIHTKYEGNLTGEALLAEGTPAPVVQALTLVLCVGCFPCLIPAPRPTVAHLLLLLLSSSLSLSSSALSFYGLLCHAH